MTFFFFFKKPPRLALFYIYSFLHYLNLHLHRHTSTPWHLISSNNVVLENEVIVATIVFDSTTGKITHIIRKDATGSREETESATGDDNDSDTSEYYDQELQALGVSLENHRNIEDLVLMPGIVDAHVHLNEVCYYPFFFFFLFFLF